MGGLKTRDYPQGTRAFLPTLFSPCVPPLSFWKGQNHSILAPCSAMSADHSPNKEKPCCPKTICLPSWQPLPRLSGHLCLCLGWCSRKGHLVKIKEQEQSLGGAYSKCIHSCSELWTLESIFPTAANTYHICLMTLHVLQISQTTHASSQISS